MDNEERHWTVARLEQRVAHGADASQIAEVVISMWQITGIILNPILGRISVDSLYQRSLFLTGQVHPWLANAYGGVQSSTDFARLKSAVMQQDGADAAAGGGALLQTFYEMLIRLIGPAVTEKLLRTMWEDHLSGQPAQDN